MFLRIVLSGIVLAALPLFAAAPTVNGNDIGPEISTFNGRELKWEEGSHDFFVMFKSLLGRKNDTYGIDRTGKDNKLNPQPDSCLTESTFILKPEQLPEDAYVTDAVLIWMGAQPYSALDKPTDGQVTLSFKGSGDVVYTKEISAPVINALDGEKSFGFESIAGMRKVVNEEHTALVDAEIGYFTYRVDITDYFEEIHRLGREKGYAFSRDALLGSWTVSGLDCTEEMFPYKQNTTMVSNWAIFFVYTSSMPGMKAKKIYMYHGLNDYQNTTTDIKVSGFQFPENPVIRLTLMSAEGDSANYVADAEHMISEGLMLRGDPAMNWAPIFNVCHPHREPFAFNGKGYDDIFNSISGFYNWNADQLYCVGGKTATPGEIDIPTAEWALDVDTFLLTVNDFPGYFNAGDAEIELQIKANNDVFYTNFLVVSLDTKPANFDIPETTEKNYCSCAPAANKMCMDSSFAYTIRVENWGEQRANKVTVQDMLPQEVEYIAGSTEIASQFDASGLGVDWKPVADGSGGAFPLQVPYLVADTLEPCSKSFCPQRYMLRFRVRAKADLAKHAVIMNTATIADSAGVAYRTNSDVPVRLTIDSSCPKTEECSAPDLCSAACGGCGTGGIPEDTDDNGGTNNDDGTVSGNEKESQTTDQSPELSDSDALVFPEEDSGCGCSLL